MGFFLGSVTCIGLWIECGVETCENSLFITVPRGEIAGCRLLRWLVIDVKPALGFLYRGCEWWCRCFRCTCCFCLQGRHVTFPCWTWRQHEPLKPRYNRPQTNGITIKEQSQQQQESDYIPTTLDLRLNEPAESCSLLILFLQWWWRKQLLYQERLFW